MKHFTVTMVNTDTADISKSAFSSSQKLSFTPFDFNAAFYHFIRIHIHVAPFPRTKYKLNRAKIVN